MFRFFDKTRMSLKKTFLNQGEGTDKFADKISIQLKSIAATAVLKALKENEGRFLSSILQRSYFQLDSLSITPEDRQTSLDFEEFLRVHEAIDPAFRQAFFHQILESEYRSESGARVRVASGFLPSIQLSIASVAEPTAEEKFQISLRGEKILFKAQALLSGPFRIESPAPSTHKQATVPSRVESSISYAQRGIPLLIDDANGRRSDELTENCIVGRAFEHSQPGFLAIQGIYVSRRHLILAIFDTDIYLILHEDASVSALLNDNLLLEDNRCYRLERNKHHRIILGIPKKSAATAPHNRSSKDFPIIELGVTNELSTVSEHTPVPRLK